MSVHEDIRHGLACNSLQSEHTISGKTACVFAHPGKIVVFPLLKWFEKRYHGKYKYARALFAFDLVLLGIVIGLAATAVSLLLLKPTDLADNIFFEASVAPHEVITGAPSTLLIRYTNGTTETLRNAKLSFGYPEHFSLESMTTSAGAVENNVITLPDLTPNTTGDVRIRGVMFGDVGGDQVFRSILSFEYGEEETFRGQKLSFYNFSPTRSALELSLSLPDQLVAGQELLGQVHYKNTSTVDFPALSVEPVWPDGFTFLEANVELRDGRFLLPAIPAGDDKVFTFRGVLEGQNEEVVFTFHPSFRFGDTTYVQDVLAHLAPVIPPQIKVEHSIDSDVRPGGNLNVRVRYENTGDTRVENLVLTLESDSPFVTEEASQTISALSPGESGTTTLVTPLRREIFSSETGTHENLAVDTRVRATYDSPETSQTVSSRSNTVEKTITSPLILESFGRYMTPSGDQLGRGPLPPFVGERTTYWVFWHVRGTTNPLESVVIEGELGPNVIFTGRQSSSQAGGIRVDGNRVIWDASRVEPTFAPDARVLGVAFELALTPAESQAGTVPLLLTNTSMTARDATTGAFLSTRAPSVSTNLPNDPRAAGKAHVER